MKIYFMCKFIMKKILKLLVAIILAIVIIGGVMFLIDCSKGKSGKEPMFAVKTVELRDGGTTEYIGLGYKIKGFNKFTGGIWAEIGPWTIELQEKGEIIVTDPDDILDNSAELENNGGDNINISGDINVESGESEALVSGDNEIDIIVSGDAEIDIVVSGDNDVEIENIKSGDKEAEIKEKKYYFYANVMSMKNNTVIVKALESEEINMTSDIFVFTLNELNNKGNHNFEIGQKLKLEYTGTILETYPAQIDVISMEILK